MASASSSCCATFSGRLTDSTSDLCWVGLSFVLCSTTSCRICRSSASSASFQCFDLMTFNPIKTLHHSGSLAVTGSNLKSFLDDKDFTASLPQATVQVHQQPAAADGFGACFLGVTEYNCLYKQTNLRQDLSSFSFALEACEYVCSGSSFEPKLKMHFINALSLLVRSVV